MSKTIYDTIEEKCIGEELLSSTHRLDKTLGGAIRHLMSRVYEQAYEDAKADIVGYLQRNTFFDSDEMEIEAVGRILKMKRW